MADDPLASSKAKLARAEKHRAELNRELTRFRKLDRYRLRIEDDSHARESVYEIRYMGTPPAKWQPILGDCLHNYRCALDHLVWTLVCAYGRRSDQRQFPMACTKGSFSRMWPQCVGPVARKGVKAAFEALQPYKRDNRPTLGPAWHPLWLLHRLDIVDKHRQLLVANLTPTYSINVSLPGFRLLEQAAQKLRFAIPFAPDGPVHMKPDVPVNIFISELDLGRVGKTLLGTATNLPLDSTITNIGTAVTDAVARLESLCH